MAEGKSIYPGRCWIDTVHVLIFSKVIVCWYGRVSKNFLADQRADIDERGNTRKRISEP